MPVKFNDEKKQMEEVSIRIKLVKGGMFGDFRITSPKDGIMAMRSMLSQMDREFVCVVNLDTKGTPLNYNIVSIGDINTSLVPMTNVFKSAILSNAQRIILFHNHPSGDCTPSKEDIELTKKLCVGGKIMDITVQDHIIVASGTDNFYSFYEMMPELFNKKLSEDTLDFVAESIDKEKSKNADKMDEIIKGQMTLNNAKTL